MLAAAASDSFTSDSPTSKVVAFGAIASSFARSKVTKPVATALDSFAFDSTAIGSIASVVAFVTTSTASVVGHLPKLLANLDYLSNSEY